MKRAPFVIAGIAFAAVFSFESYKLLVREPPHPRATIEDDDYPLAPGLTWVYKSAMGLQVVRRAKMSFMFVDENPPDWLQMEFDLPMLGRKSLYMRRTSEGVLARRNDIQQLIMRFPMRPGDSWTIDFPEEDLAECTVLEPEEITVLKKRTSASKLQVVRTNRKSGKKTTDYEWYAKGIGLVRMEVTFGIKAIFELERFEKAK